MSRTRPRRGCVVLSVLYCNARYMPRPQATVYATSPMICRIEWTQRSPLNSAMRMRIPPVGRMQRKTADARAPWRTRRVEELEPVNPLADDVELIAPPEGEQPLVDRLSLPPEFPSPDPPSPPPDPSPDAHVEITEPAAPPVSGEEVNGLMSDPPLDFDISQAKLAAESCMLIAALRSLVLSGVPPLVA